MEENEGVKMMEKRVRPRPIKGPGSQDNIEFEQQGIKRFAPGGDLPCRL